MKEHFNKGKKYPNRKRPEPFTVEHKKHMSDVKKGKIPKNINQIKGWNKGKKLPQFSGKNSSSWKGGKPKCRICNKQLSSYSVKFCQEHTGKGISIGKMGQHWKVKDTSKMKRFGNKNPFFGKKHSEITIQKIREKKLGKKSFITTRLLKSKSMMGKNSKGGITPINKLIRNGIEFRLWREAVFARDNWTCQKCSKRNGSEIHPHHIKNFSQYPEIRFALDNGITLCRDCHKLFHKIYSRKNNNKEQLQEFLCPKT